MLGKVFPVGSTYFNKTDSRNPNIILGFGTWVELGGVVLAGKKTGDDTFANTGTIGAKTHTLTVAQMPQHKHSNNIRTNALGFGDFATAVASNTGSSDNTGVFIGDTGGGQAHPNIQPTLIGYMWERTA